MDNWITISNILLGIGSVFLNWAIFHFLILTSLQIPVYPAFMALPMVTPLLIVAILAYVVGAVDYFAGKEKTFQEQNTVKPIRRKFSKYVNPLWSIHIGAFCTPVLLALQMGLGFKSYLIMFVSISVGVAVGLICLALLYFWNHR